MSQGYSGVNAQVHVGANDVDASSWNADVETNTWDSTTTADGGWDDMSSSTSKISGSFDILYNKAKKPFGTLGLTQGAIVALVLYISSVDGDNLAGNALITKISPKTKVKEGIILTVSWTGKGSWTLPS